MQIFCLIISILLFFAGGSIYVLYRSLSLRMFFWFKELGVYHTILSIRDAFGFYKLPDWVVYSLPDGLWMSSYIILTAQLWHKNYSNEALALPLTLPLFVNVSELMQALGLFPGTFDINDIVCYDIPVIIYILKFVYEKNNSIIHFCPDNGNVSVNGSRI